MIEFTQTTTQVPSDIPTVIAPTTIEATQYQTYEYLIYFFFGLIDSLLAIRFVFKLTGASSNSNFVSFIYSLTNFLQSPFNGIFNRVSQSMNQSTTIFEPSTLVAILIYALIAWGIVKLVRISSGEKQLD